MKPSFELSPLRRSLPALLLSSVSLLGACGQIGPLTLPPKPLARSNTAPVTPDTTSAPASKVTPVSSNSPFATPSGPATATPASPADSTDTPALPASK